MDLSPELFLLVCSLLIFCSIIISKVSVRFGVPVLLLFLFVGMLSGIDGLGIHYNHVSSAQHIGTIALCIILFSGGMNTSIKEIKPILWQGITLSTVGVLLTTIFTGLFIYWLAGLPNSSLNFTLLGAMLLAATMSSTDSASVFNILRSQKMHLKYNLRPLLEFESGSNDPMAYLLTIILIGSLQTGEFNTIKVIIDFLIQFIVGGLCGFLLGYGLVYFTNKIKLNNHELYPLLALSGIFLIYTIIYLSHGNGFLAVYVAGMVAGNSKLTKKRETNTFLDGMTWLFQIIMFVTLGLLVNPHEMADVALMAILIGLFLVIIGRPLSVLLCMIPFARKINKRSIIFTSIVGLRGAVPIIFATYPVVAEVECANQIFNIVFFITILSLLIQGMSIPYFARKLKLSEPLVESGNHLGIELPEETNSRLHEIVFDEHIAQKGNTLKDISLPEGMLVMIVKRGEKYMVPNGNIKLHIGDILVIVSENREDN
ncbi:potassium/proton antiporter [Phocaeicola paurosaccharolyticus]|uniref:potassium/proton antiporter n=1 Tax=Phocaeicola paurosaccharolyticus TaxID=732242 RepID=UPI000468517A|nr:potassium/proton antiporter [Phocaeicola paurosaccharolyticus]